MTDELARYELHGEFMKRSADGGWVRFDDLAPQAECGKGKAQPIATLHDDGHWTWKKGTTPPHESNYAGWRMDVCAVPQDVDKEK